MPPETKQIICDAIAVTSNPEDYQDLIQKLKKCINDNSHVQFIKILNNDVEVVLRAFLSSDPEAKDLRKNFFYNKNPYFITALTKCVLRAVNKDFDSFIEEWDDKNKKKNPELKKTKTKTDILKSSFLNMVWKKYFGKLKEDRADFLKFFDIVAIYGGASHFVLKCFKENNQFIAEWVSKNYLDIKKIENVGRLLKSNTLIAMQFHFMVMMAICKSDCNTFKNEEEVVKYFRKTLSRYPRLLSMREKFSVFDNSVDPTLLHVAASRNGIEPFKTILEKSKASDVSRRDGVGQTAFHLVLRNFLPENNKPSFFLDSKNREHAQNILILLVNKNGFNGSASSVLGEKVPSAKSAIKGLLQIKNPEWVALAFKNWSFTRKKDGSVFTKDELYEGLKTKRFWNEGKFFGLDKERRLGIRELSILIKYSKPNDVEFKDFITDEVVSASDDNEVKALLFFLKYKDDKNNGFEKGKEEFLKKCGNNRRNSACYKKMANEWKKNNCESNIKNEINISRTLTKRTEIQDVLDLDKNWYDVEQMFSDFCCVGSCLPPKTKLQDTCLEELFKIPELER